jgi:hypothetical protein
MDAGQGNRPRPEQRLFQSTQATNFLQGSPLRPSVGGRTFSYVLGNGDRSSDVIGTGSNNFARFFLTEITALLTGQTLNASSADALSSVPGSSSTSPSHVGQSFGSRITGIRS